MSRPGRLLRPVKRYLVWPTPRGWGMMAAAVASFGVTMVNPSFAGGVFTAFLGALVLTGVALAACSLYGLELKREPCSDGVMGQALPLPLTITNQTSWHRPPLLVGEVCPFTGAAVSFAVTPRLGPREQHYLRREVAARWRGVYQLNEVWLRAGDAAGLFYCEKVFSCPQPLIIYPDRAALTWMPLRLKSRVVAALTVSASALSGAGQEFFGIREYRPTDGIRAIHWKASAHHHRLLVRQYEDNAIRQVSIFLDTHRDHVSTELAFDNFEYLVKLTASMADYVAGVHCRVLFHHGGQPAERAIEGSAQAARERILAELAAVETTASSDVAEAILNALEAIPPSSILYCLTMHEPPHLEETFRFLLRKGVDVRWIHAPAALFTVRDAKREQAVTEFAARQTQAVKPLIVGPRANIPQVLSYG